MVGKATSPLRLKPGIVFSRVPVCLGARCRKYGLTGNEKDLLVALMAHMVQDDDGSIRLLAGNASMLAELTGMRAPNVRSALASLRKKGVIEGESGGPYLLKADIWRPEEIERSAMRPAHGAACDAALPSARERMAADAPIKKEEGIKNTHKKRGVTRCDYD